jgi:hypothetical protein
LLGFSLHFLETPVISMFTAAPLVHNIHTHYSHLCPLMLLKIPRTVPLDTKPYACVKPNQHNYTLGRWTVTYISAKSGYVDLKTRVPLGFDP